MTLTGNASHSPRRPFGNPIPGRYQFQLWATAVSLPRLPRASGIERRLAVLPTLRKLTEREVDEEGGTDQALLDAVITLGAQEAQRYYQLRDTRKYEAPEGDRVAKEEALKEMDELAYWLEELSDDWDGAAVKAVREEAWKYFDSEKISAT